jgi:hypothetical protein
MLVREIFRKNNPYRYYNMRLVTSSVNTGISTNCHVIRNMMFTKRIIIWLHVYVQLIYLLAAVGTITGSLSHSSNDEEDEETSMVERFSTFRIAGYLPDYRFGIDLNQTALLVDDLYLFSLSPQPQLGDMIFAVCCLNEDHFEKAKQAVSYAHTTAGKDVKVWVTIGGGGRSNGYMKDPGTSCKGAIERA